MSPAAAWRGVVAKLSFSAENRHHGLQLAAAVLLSYVLAVLIGLPEQFWAVMSTLIVMRPQAGATLEAGWERVAGTLAGVLLALAGVVLHHFGVSGLAVTLAVVALLAFVSASAPMLRSAPVAALIILSGADIPGHSPLQVAGLRVAQIVIGVAVALAISMVSARYRAAQRLHAGCAALLRQAAQQLQQRPSATADEGAQEAAGAAMRTALGRLTLLAASADRESRLFRRTVGAADRQHHKRVAGLMRRIVQDMAMLNRVLRAPASGSGNPLALQGAQAASAALASVADVVAGLDGRSDASVGARPALGELRRLAHAEVAGAQDAGLMLAAPLRLLLADLQRLCYSVGGASQVGPAAAAQS